VDGTVVISAVLWGREFCGAFNLQLGLVAGKMVLSKLHILLLINGWQHERLAAAVLGGADPLLHHYFPSDRLLVD
jgi:hypothetical protein